MAKYAQQSSDRLNKMALALSSLQEGPWMAESGDQARRNALWRCDSTGNGSTLSEGGENQEEQGPQPNKRKRDRQEDRPQHCAVCHKAANCCHFDVSSCLGCRSFFRRSVLQQKLYVCRREGKCPVDQGEMCRACRFDRCLLCGMNVRAIRSAPANLNLEQTGRELEKRRQELILRRQRDSAVSTVAVSRRDQQSELRLLSALLYVELRHNRIRHSETPLAKEFYAGKDMLELTLKNDNTLALAESFSEKALPFHSREYFDQMMARGQDPPNLLIADLFLNLEVAKTMSVLKELSLPDKMALLCANAVCATVFSQCFYSYCARSETLIFPNGFSPLYLRKFNVKAENMFLNIMKPFREIALSLEEFLLIRGIILLLTVSAELSKSAVELLQAEVDNYSRELMRYERIRLGDTAGIKRYAQMMFFLDVVLRSGNEHREFLVFFLTVVNPQTRKSPIPGFMESSILGVPGSRRSSPSP